MISYCFTAYRPVYDRLLVDDLVRKTTVPYEILVWINTPDEGLERFLHQRADAGVPIRIVGKTPHNIGMIAYRNLFEQSRFDLVVQLDDDVVCVSRRIAEIAHGIFERHAEIKQIAADVVVDRFTWGNRPPIEEYRPYLEESGLHIGSIDGWFSIYHRSVLPLVLAQNYTPFCSIGWSVQRALADRGMLGLLSTRLKVFHVVGAPYHSHFGMLEFEVRKWDAIKGPGGGDSYRKSSLPPAQEVAARVEEIKRELDVEPRADG